MWRECVECVAMLRLERGCESFLWLISELKIRVGILFAVPAVEANCLSPEAEVYLQSKECFFCKSMDLKDFDG